MFQFNNVQSVDLEAKLRFTLVRENCL